MYLIFRWTYIPPSSKSASNDCSGPSIASLRFTIAFAISLSSLSRLSSNIRTSINILLFASSSGCSKTHMSAQFGSRQFLTLSCDMWYQDMDTTVHTMQCKIVWVASGVCGRYHTVTIPMALFAFEPFSSTVLSLYIAPPDCPIVTYDSVLQISSSVEASVTVQHGSEIPLKAPAIFLRPLALSWIWYLIGIRIISIPLSLRSTATNTLIKLKGSVLYSVTCNKVTNFASLFFDRIQDPARIFYFDQ